MRISHILMHIKIMQINLNKNWRAYDLLTQYMTEEETAIGIVSELPSRKNPNSTGWFLAQAV